MRGFASNLAIVAFCVAPAVFQTADSKPITIVFSTPANSVHPNGSFTPRPNTANGGPYFVPRYENGRLEQRLEVESGNCAFLSAGTATVTSQAKYGVATVGTPPCTIPLDYYQCQGITYPACSVVYYTRIQHNNKSVRPDPSGAIDTFTYHWQTPDNFFNLDFGVDVVSPVVRPMSEEIVPSGTYESAATGYFGAWASKLIPPSDDSAFDFGGDTVREDISILSDSCRGRAPFLNVVVGGHVGSWEVGKFKQPTGTIDAPKNSYGYDLVGWAACSVEGYRCARATTPPCQQSVAQRMSHHAQSEPAGMYTFYATNMMTETLGGGVTVLPTSAVAPTLGPITSIKNGQKLDMPQAYTNLSFCPLLRAYAKQLPGCFP